MKNPDSKKIKRGLVWLRRDLRLIDNHALSIASQECDELALVFIFDKNILDRLPNRDDRRVTFIFESLSEMQKKLKDSGANLIIEIGSPTEVIPRLVNELEVNCLYYNHDFESYAKARDQSVTEKLRHLKCETKSFKDHVIFEGLEVSKDDGTPYTVFTPYKNKWLKQFHLELAEPFKNKKTKPILTKSDSDLNSIWKKLGFGKNSPIIEPGRSSGVKLLTEFSKEKIKKYKSDRDFPISDGTSKISMHLRFGTISIREAAKAATSGRGLGYQTFLSELIWRDFYQMILNEFPHVEKSSFKPAYKEIKWPGKPEHFEAWKNGVTGYPLVDAAMRYFKETGWMHNRLRMVVASFLVKDLLIDWKWGEKYFAENLLDFDLSANNGGWQWCASTGCDAQPYFRIFNPTEQSKRFDPDGEFIKMHVPELKSLDKKSIHAPREAGPLALKSAGVVLGKDYPNPIVDHSVQRKKALLLFQSYKQP